MPVSVPARRPGPRALVASVAIGLVLPGCTLPPGAGTGEAMPLSAMDGDSAAVMPAATAVAAAPPVSVVAVTGRGFAQVAGQPGGTLGERRLMAIRAARLEALRDLAEQVHGAGLSAETVVRDSVVVDDEVRARLATALRGARTVAINPRGNDGYEVVLQLDPASLAMVNRILRADP